MDRRRGGRLLGGRWIHSRTNQLTIQSHTRTVTGTQWADLQTKCEGVCVCVCMCVCACLMCVFDAACCTVSACVCPHAFGCIECVHALACFVCVGRLIVCCGESAEGHSKAHSYSSRGEECCGICLQQQKTATTQKETHIIEWREKRGII